MGTMSGTLSKPISNFDFSLPPAGPAPVCVDWSEGGETLVIGKPRPGFDRASVDSIAAELRAIGSGAYPSLKFLVFDLAGGEAAATQPPQGFADLVAATADLIIDTPVITLAWARGLLGGLDFDFAMNCSMSVAEADARFSFAGEPFDLLGLYATVGRRIGFARAERLIESDRLLTAEEAKELMLVKDVVNAAPGLEGVTAYLSQFDRRYNASHAIFRAQRMAEPPIDRRPVNAVTRG